MLAVAIGLIAAPLWALSHIVSTGGDGMGTKTAYGYSYLVKLMLKPVLMVISFFIAAKIVVVVGNFLNSAFMIAVMNAQTDSITGVLSVIGFLGIYTSVCIAFITSVFNLVLIITRQALNFAGLQVESVVNDLQGAGKEGIQGSRNFVNSTNRFNHQSKNKSSDSATDKKTLGV